MKNNQNLFENPSSPTEKSKLSALSAEELHKRKDLLKGVSIGFGIIYLFAISLAIYLFVSKGSANYPIAALIPIFALPVTCTPLFINLSSVNKEIESRQSK